MTFLSTFDERHLLVADLDGALIGGSEKSRRHLRTALEQVRDSLIFAIPEEY